jgi:hypothetical protein
MAFGVSGFTAGAVQDAFQRMLARDLLEQQRLEQRQQQQFENQMRQRQLATTEAGLASTEAARREALERQARLDKLAEAQLASQMLERQFDITSGAPLAVSPETAGRLAGTPYESLVEKPHPVWGEAGQITYVPSGTQQQAVRGEAQKRQQLEALQRIIQDPTASPELKTLVGLRQAGVETSPIGREAVMTPETRQAEADRAFEEFQRRQQFQEGLIRGRPVRGAGPMTASQRATALRQARRDAVAAYEAERGDRLTLTDETGRPIPLDEYIDQYVEDYFGALGEEGPGNVEESPVEPPMFSSRGQVPGQVPGRGAIGGGRRSVAPSGGGTVRMQAPDGTVTNVPAAEVEFFRQRGATVVP